MKHLTLLKWVALGVLAGCGSANSDATTTPEPALEASAETQAVEAPPSLEAAVAGTHRSAENRARDAHRHPQETLEFFGIEPQMSVIELSPGAGWYTEILAPYLRAEGTLIEAVPDPSSEYGQRFVAFTQTHPELYDQIQSVVWSPPEQLSLGESNSADMVLTFRSIHHWIERDQAAAILASIFDVLKPGGVLGLAAHRADAGTDPAVTAPTGYVSEEAVIALAEAAGFVLEGRSEINANERDNHDHPEGVWTLPPTLRLGDQDRAQYEAIGESDRMTLRFRKPAN